VDVQHTTERDGADVEPPAERLVELVDGEESVFPDGALIHVPEQGVLETGEDVGDGAPEEFASRPPNQDLGRSVDVGVAPRGIQYHQGVAARFEDAGERVAVRSLRIITLPDAADRLGVERGRAVGRGRCLRGPLAASPCSWSEVM